MKFVKDISIFYIVVLTVNLIWSSLLLFHGVEFGRNVSPIGRNILFDAAAPYITSFQTVGKAL
jgi:hypothetical protein